MRTKTSLSFLLPVFLLCATINFSSAQNLAVNGDFENYSALPSGYGQWSNCVGISNLNNWPTFMWPYASPDYLHSSGAAGVQLPNTTFGTVNAYNGNAIFGFVTWYAQSTPDFREYVSVPLSTPLTPGNQYQCTYYITSGSSNLYCGGGSDHVGCQFSVGTIPQVDHEPVGGIPHYEIPGQFFSSTWAQQTFTFTAAAPYDQVCFGNFYNDAATTGSQFAPGGGGAYYFIDMVEVIPLNVQFSINGDTSLCLGEPTVITAYNTTTCWWESLTNPGVSIDNDSILNVTPLSTTTYVAHGDTATDTLTVYVHALPIVNLGNDTTICGAINLVLDAGNAGSSYAWNTLDITQTINVVAAGNYSVTVTTAFGCTATDAINIISSPNISVNLGNDTTLCSGNNVVVTAGANPYNYLWSSGESTNTITVTATGNYSVTVTNGGCVGTDAIQINISTPPSFSLGNDTLLCTGATYTISAPAGYNYVWSNGATTQTISVTNNGAYSVVVDDGICNNTDLVNVGFFDPHFADIGPDLTMCAGDVTTIVSVLGGQQNLWSTGATTAFISVHDSGNYWLQQTYQGCTSTDSLHISLVPHPHVGLPDDVAFCGSDPLDVEAYTYSTTILWMNGDTGTHTIVSVFPATVWATVTNGYCSASDTMHITLNCELWVPNAFSPNGDGTNDEFKIMDSEVSDFKLQIYNRWGELVYETDNASKGWNGTFRDVNAAVGVYVYNIKATLADNRTVVRKGNVTLLR